MKIFCGFKSRNNLDELIGDNLTKLGHHVHIYKYCGDRSFIAKSDNNKTLFLYNENKITTIVINIIFPIFIIKLFKILFWYDCYFFFAGYSLLSLPLKWKNLNFLRYLDIILLKIMGKKIVYTFQGSDLRFECSKPPIDRQRVFKYANAIMVTTPDLINYIPNIQRFKTSILNRPINFINIPLFKKDYSRKLRVLHAPTSYELKGTKHIEKAFKELKDLDVELIILSNTTKEHVLETAKTCDFAIDQLILGWYGVFTLEMLSLGLPVMCYMSNSAIENAIIPLEELPVTNIHIDSIAKDIKSMCENVKNDKWLSSFDIRRKSFLRSHYSDHALKEKLKIIIKDFIK